MARCQTRYVFSGTESIPSIFGRFMRRADEAFARIGQAEGGKVFGGEGRAGRKYFFWSEEAEK